MNKGDIVLFLQESIQEEIIAEANYTERAAVSMQLYSVTGDPRFKANADRWTDVAKDENEHKREFMAQLDEWGALTKLEMVNNFDFINNVDVSKTMAEIMPTMDMSKMNQGDMKVMHDTMMKSMRMGKGMVMDKMPNLKRKLPDTYGEWVNLAEDIKAADSKLTTWNKVNDCLNVLAAQNSYFLEVNAGESVNNAKKWLIEKAAELKIK